MNEQKTQESIALLAEQMDRLRGRLLGMVEAVGFPPRQEAGIKSILKSLTYDAQAELAETLVSSCDDTCQCSCEKKSNV